MIEVNEVIQAIDEKLTEFLPAAMERLSAPVYTTLFRQVSDPRRVFRSEAMHAQGRMKEFGQGAPIFEEQPFEGGLVTITPVPIGTAKSWSRSIIEQVLAEGHDLKSAAENWVQSYFASRDIQASDMITGSATGYDGKALFATDHPVRSKFNSGGDLDNTNANAAAATLDAAFLDAILTIHEDTIAYGENGEPIDNFATHLVATTRAHFSQIKVLLGSIQKAGTGNNDINPERGAFTPVYWRRPYNATTQIYAVTAGQGLLSVERRGFTQESWYDPNNKSFKASADFEAACGWNNFRSISRKRASA